MGNLNRKKYWENIYQKKQPNEVGWYQPVPKTSLDFVKNFEIPKTAKIIDVGGGDSFFVDNLLDLGYQDITVLDISDEAINRAKQRLGARSAKVKWIIEDAAAYKPNDTYDFWHDRAAFHFLTNEQHIKRYIETVQQSINPKGILVIGTFSEEGPKKCSGLEIKQYSETTMTNLLNKFFDKIKCINVDHITPFGNIQNYIFCSFSKVDN